MPGTTRNEARINAECGHRPGLRAARSTQATLAGSTRNADAAPGFALRAQPRLHSCALSPGYTAARSTQATQLRAQPRLHSCALNPSYHAACEFAGKAQVS